MKTALVFGSSGLIGGHLLSQLIENDDYNKIKIFVRSEPENNDPKVEIIKTDFRQMFQKTFCVNQTRIHAAW